MLRGDRRHTRRLRFWHHLAANLTARLSPPHGQTVRRAAATGDGAVDCGRTVNRPGAEARQNREVTLLPEIAGFGTLETVFDLGPVSAGASI